MADSQSMIASFHEHLASMERVAASMPTIARIADTIGAALERGGKVLTCGNGGSAAEALHMAEEMIGRFAATRRPLAAICLSADPTAMTCISNDFGYEEVFARQVRGLGRRGDVLVGLTTSGRSPNVLRAYEAAREMGISTIGLLGPPGSAAEALCDVALTGEGMKPAHVQEMHLLTIHLVLEQLDKQFSD